LGVILTRFAPPRHPEPAGRYRLGLAASGRLHRCRLAGRRGGDAPRLPLAPGKRLPAAL